MEFCFTLVNFCELLDENEIKDGTIFRQTSSNKQICILNINYSPELSVAYIIYYGGGYILFLSKIELVIMFVTTRHNK